MKKFDTVLWRINGLTILLSTIAMFGMFIVGIVSSSIPRNSGMRNSDTITPEMTVVNEATQKEERFQLATPNLVAKSEGNYMVRLFLVEDESGAFGRGFKSYSSYSNQETANYLFYNIDSDDQQWLFDTNNQRITSYFRINKEYEYRSNPSYSSYTNARILQDSVNYILYSVIDEDSNDDTELDNEDSKSIYRSKNDGTGLVKLISGIDNTPSVSQHSSDKTMISYYSNGKYLVTIVGIDGEIVSTTELDI